MFFSDPILDMEITITMVFVSACLGIIVGLMKKDWKIAVAVFSVLSNLAFLVNIGSRMFQAYHIIWLFWVSVCIWPIINLLFIIWIARNKKGK